MYAQKNVILGLVVVLFQFKGSLKKEKLAILIICVLSERYLVHPEPLTGHKMKLRHLLQSDDEKGAILKLEK